MSIIDIVLAFPIGIIYTVLLFKATDILYKDLPYQEKIHNTAITLFICSILGIIIGYKIFNKNNLLDNLSMRLGLYGGSVMMVFYSVIKQWDHINDVTKLLIFSILLGVIIIYIYIRAKNNNNINKNNNNKLAEIYKIENS